MKNNTLKTYISQSIKIFKDNIKFILLISLLIFLPYALTKVLFVNQIMDQALLNDYVLNIESYVNATDKESLAVISQITKQFSAYLIFSFVLSLFTLIGDVMVIRLSYNHKEGIAEDFFEGFESSIRIYPRALWTLIIQTMFIAFGFFLVLPGIYFYFAFRFALFISVLYKIKGKRATNYSALVVRGNFSKVIGYSMLVILFNFSLSYIFSFIISFIKLDYASTIAEIIGQTLILGLTTIGIIFFTLFFLDLQEGLNENINNYFNIDLSNKTHEGQE